MCTHIKSLSKIIMVVVIAVALPNMATGQSVWLPPQHGSSFSLEVLKPDYAGEGVSFMTTVWYLAGRNQIKPSVAMIVEFPLSYFAETDGPESEFGVGNPYFGISFEGENSMAVVEGGIRLPIASERKFSSMINGWYADFDRWTAFFPNLLTIKARAGVKLTGADGKVMGRILIGGSMLAATKGDNSELMGDLSAGIWFRDNQYQIGLNFVGNTVLTVEDHELGERTELQVGLGAAGTFGQVRPAIHLQVPIGDEGFIYRGTVLDLVFGINVTIFVPSKTI